MCAPNCTPSRSLLIVLVSFAIIPFWITTGQSEPALTIKTFPSVCMEPCSVRIAVRTARNSANRRLRIEVDSGSFLRSSTRQLDGADAPLVHAMELQALPAGHYEVTAIVESVPEHSSHGRGELIVNGPSNEW